MNDHSWTHPIRQEEMTRYGIAPDRPRMIHGGKWRQVEHCDCLRTLLDKSDIVMNADY